MTVEEISDEISAKIKLEYKDFSSLPLEERKAKLKQDIESMRSSFERNVGIDPSYTKEDQDEWDKTINSMIKTVDKYYGKKS